MRPGTRSNNLPRTGCTGLDPGAGWVMGVIMYPLLKRGTSVTPQLFKVHMTVTIVSCMHHYRNGPMVNGNTRYNSVTVPPF